MLLILSKSNSGAAGLNLYAARHVVLMEPLLDLGLEQQCKARVHRLGQTRDVKVLRLVAAGTVEEQLVVPSFFGGGRGNKGGAKAAASTSSGTNSASSSAETQETVLAAKRDAALQTIGALSTGDSTTRNEVIVRLLGIPVVPSPAAAEALL